MSRLKALGAALGDATRFSIFRFVVESAHPVSASEVADRFGVHRTVARSHLEKLAQASLVVVSARRNPGGGRPAKVYAPSPERLEVQLPPRRFESLSQMLLRMVVGMNGAAVPAALDVGLESGRELARALPGNGGASGRPDVVKGYRPMLVTARDDLVVLEVGNCAYREVAEGSPEIVCALSSGLLCGLLGAPLEGHTHSRSLMRGDAACRHEFVL
jgi:predicted ArsR family transcriptional regulator